MVLAGEALELVVVEQAVVGADAVLDGVEPFARQVGGGAVGEVAARRQRHAERGVAGPEEGEEDGLVGLGATVGLDVGEGAVEQLAGAVDGELLGDVDFRAAAVVAATGIALGIFVGQNRALGFEDCGGDDVLAGDELDAVLLAGEFAGQGRGELGVGFGQGGAEEAVEAHAGGGLLVHGMPLACWPVRCIVAGPTRCVRQAGRFVAHRGQSV